MDNNFPNISPEQWKEVIHALFADWNPMAPTRAYCESVGWPVNDDGTVDTPGGFRLVTSDRLEVEELERLYKL